MTYLSPVPARNLQVNQSTAPVVEEDSYQRFTIAVSDVEGGSISASDIDITSIVVSLKKSVVGVDFAEGTITQPVFSKGTGVIYCNYRFLAAEWEIGDSYDLTVSGITVTIDDDTAYVKTCNWSNVVLEEKNIETQIITIQNGIGDPASRTNLQTIEDMLGNDDVAGESIYKHVQVISTTPIHATDPSSVAPVANTLTDILHKDAGSTYDNATDSLEAISDLVTTATSSVAEIPSETNAKTFNATALASIEAEVEDAIQAVDLDHILQLDGATQVYPENCATDSILAKILAKGDPAVPSTFNNATDSLEAISDLVTTVDTVVDGNATALAHGTYGLSALQVLIAALQTDLGNPSVRTNLQTIEDMLGNDDTAGESLYKHVQLINTKPIEAALGGGVEPVANTLSDILHKDGSYTYDNTTDSLEAISDLVTTVDTVVDGNATALAHGTYGLSALQVLIAALQTDLDNATDGLGALKALIDTVDTVVDSNAAKLIAGIPQTVSVQTVDGSATQWTPAAHRLFTVTGTVLCRTFAVTDETLTENNGDETIEVGIAGNTALLLAQYATPLDFATGDIWGSTTAVPGSTLNDMVCIKDTDIDLTVAGTTGINDGQMTFYCQWIPVSVGATVVAGVWD